MKNEGIYLTLMAQVDKLHRHNRQGSFRTKQRYYEAMQRFCKFLADVFRLQKLTNISGKHLEAYVRHLQTAGRAVSTIKTDLAAIRFYHDLMDAKYRLPDNSELDLERRHFGDTDRSWTDQEIFRFLERCSTDGERSFADIAELSVEMGLRIHEGFRLDTAAAAQALRTGFLSVKGKGGKIRNVPATIRASEVLADALSNTKRGHKLFVPDNVPTDVEIKRMQNYIASVRPDIQAVGSERPMTHHGLRHTYAVRKYQEFIAAGFSSDDAAARVSKLLGHERKEITRVYLASLRVVTPKSM